MAGKLTLADFLKISKQRPIPEDLLTLPIRDSKLFKIRLTYQDFGFEEHPRVYSERAHSGDEDAILLCDQAKDWFKELMELDVEMLPVYNDLSGEQEFNEDGSKANAPRTRWRDVPGDQVQLLAFNTRLPLDFWFQYVDHNWLNILPHLRWFDPAPSTDPEDPHTAALIARKLHPGNPQRKTAIKFLETHGIKAAEEDPALLKAEA